MRAKVREGSPGGSNGTTGIGFVKRVGFKPGMKREGVSVETDFVNTFKMVLINTGLIKMLSRLVR